MSKYSALFEDEDDVFLGSPESKLMDVIFTANNDVVRYDLAEFIKTRAAFEIMLAEKVGEDFADNLKTFMFERADEIETKTKSLYIELMGDIVSKSE